MTYTTFDTEYLPGDTVFFIKDGLIFKGEVSKINFERGKSDRQSFEYQISHRRSKREIEDINFFEYESKGLPIPFLNKINEKGNFNKISSVFEQDIYRTEEKARAAVPIN